MGEQKQGDSSLHPSSGGMTGSCRLREESAPFCRDRLLNAMESVPAFGEADAIRGRRFLRCCGLGGSLLGLVSLGVLLGLWVSQATAAPLQVSLGVDILPGSCTVGVDAGSSTVTLANVDGGAMEPHNTYSPTLFNLAVDCSETLPMGAAATPAVPAISVSGTTLIGSMPVEGAYIFSGTPGMTDAQGVGVALIISKHNAASDMPANLSGKYTSLLKNGELMALPASLIKTDGSSLPVANIPVVAAVTSGSKTPTQAGPFSVPVTFSFAYR